MTLLDELKSTLGELGDEDRKAVTDAALSATAGHRFVPNPGPQTDAWFSDADETFFGGGAGGGKSALLCGLAIEQHQRSIIFRREYPQIKGLVDEVARILGTRTGYNAQNKLWRLSDDKRVARDVERDLEFGSVPHEDDKEKYQGRAHDLNGNRDVLRGTMVFSVSTEQLLTITTNDPIVLGTSNITFDDVDLTGGLFDGAVRADEAQGFSTAEKTQARANIGAISQTEADAARDAALAASVRFDTAQSLTTDQRARARSNIGAISETDATAPAWVPRASVGGVTKIAAIHFDFRAGLYWCLGQVFDAFSDIADFSRASTAWIRGTDGVWSTVGVDVPRIGTVIGLMMEGAGSNDVLWSRDLRVTKQVTAVGGNGLAFTVGETVTFGNGVTGKYAGGSGSPTSVHGFYDLSGTPTGTLMGATATRAALSATVNVWVHTQCTVTKTDTGIDGVANAACRITATGGSAKISQVLDRASSDCCFSFFAKRVGTLLGTIRPFTDDFATGTFSSPDITADLETGVFRSFISRPLSASDPANPMADPTAPMVGIRLVGDVGDVIIVDMAQSEPLGRSTSPMPTTTAPGSRSADTFTVSKAFGAMVSNVSTFTLIQRWAVWTIWTSGTCVSIDVDGTSDGGRMITNWRVTQFPQQAAPHDGNMGVTSDTAATDATGLDPEQYVTGAPATCTISNATPGIVTKAAHSFGIASEVEFTTTGVLPAPLVAGTSYYVCGGATYLANSFALATSEANAVAGTAIATTSAGSGTHSAINTSNNLIKMERSRVGESNRPHVMAYTWERDTDGVNGTIRVVGDGSPVRSITNRAKENFPDNIANMRIGHQHTTPTTTGAYMHGAAAVVTVFDGLMTEAELLPYGVP